MICFLFSYEHTLDYQTLPGKEPVHFLGRLLVGWTRESGGNQAYYEHSVQLFVTL